MTAPIAIQPAIMASKLPVYLHPQTGAPFMPQYTELESVFVIVGVADSHTIGGLVLHSHGVTALDTSVISDYSTYRSLGIAAFRDFGLDGATNFWLYVQPTLGQIRAHLGDLLASPRPSTLHTQRVRQMSGNVYVPDYARLVSGFSNDVSAASVASGRVPPTSS